MENEKITLRVETKFGFTHIEFEVLKVEGYRYILYAQEKVCAAKLNADGSWTLSDPLNLATAFKETKTKLDKA